MIIRVVLPYHLYKLANTSREVQIKIAGQVTLRAILDGLEREYPMLRGTIRDPFTDERRPFIRFFAGGEDLSHQSPDALLPKTVANGEDKLLIVGALAGG